MLSFLSGINPKYIIYSGVLLAIFSSVYFGYRYVENMRADYEKSIRELTLAKQAYQENINTLERLLEEEKKREKTKIVYVDRIKEVKGKTVIKRQEIEKLEDTEINTKFKEIMKCFEKAC